MATIFLCIIYGAFISLGLPGSMLSAAWTAIQPIFKFLIAMRALISTIISGGTVISILLSSRLLKWLGTEKLTLFSVFMTSNCINGIFLCSIIYLAYILAVPLGLGAGAIDSGLNTYIAKHCKSYELVALFLGDWILNGTSSNIAVHFSCPIMEKWIFYCFYYSIYFSNNINFQLAIVG